MDDDGRKGKTASNKDDDSILSSDEEEGELPPEGKSTKRRRLIEGDDIQEESSPPPPSPDHTYKTEDDNSDQEREWDMELLHMDPCKGTDELQSLADDDDDYDDDDGDDSGDDDVEHVVVRAERAVKLSASTHNLEGLVRVRGMSAKESSMSKNYQENLADRITAYVRKHLFRVVKFISNEHMFGKAFKQVMDHECVANGDRVKFQTLYESVFNHALNSKRSTCEQAGKAIMMKELKRCKEDGIDRFTIEELAKLRRASTEREKQAFLWFFGTFLECVSGQKHWGAQKWKQLVSEASSWATKHGKLVTVSDEAFALLLYDNYAEKWVKAFEQQERHRLETMAAPQPGGTASGGRKAGREREKGKYTAQKTGHCKYGGWNREGMVAYNSFYHIVKDDRASEHAMDMEREVLAHCMALRRRGTNGEEGACLDSSPAREEVGDAIEACWDLDVDAEL